MSHSKPRMTHVQARAEMQDQSTPGTGGQWAKENEVEDLKRDSIQLG